MHWTTRTTASLALILLLIVSSGTTARTYRWVDENGRVRYSDRLPPEYVDKARSHLDRRGIETQRVERAKTQEELARDAELKQLQAEQQRLIEAQREKDRALLRTFRNEDDIQMARDGKLASIDTSIRIDRSNIHRLKLKLATLQKNAADAERSGSKVSDSYLKQIEGTRKTLKDAHANIIRKEQHKVQIREKHQADLVRFRELKHLHQPQQEHSDDKTGRVTLLETVVFCPDQGSCDALWQRAEAYVREHATTRMQLLAESIIMTAAPLKDKDITIAVSRIVEPESSAAKLFMDLQCKESPRGKEFCATAEVEAIRAGFRSYMDAEATPQTR